MRTTGHGSLGRKKMTRQESAPTLNIISQLNQKNEREIREQTKDVEIERLTTTCKALNGRVMITESLESSIKVM